MFGTMNADMFKDSPIQKQYDSLGNDPQKFNEFINKVIQMDLKPYDWSRDVKSIKAPVFMAIGDADGVYRSTHRHLEQAQLFPLGNERIPIRLTGLHGFPAPPSGWNEP